MKQLQSERVFLNMAGKESSQTVRLTLHLQDDVDGAILKEAVEATRQRYPYHQVRLCTRGDEQGIAHYAFDDNPLPWVVTAGRQQVLMCEGHPIICLTDNGFRDYYKPADSLFEACAAGRLLILSPWPYDAGKRHISRADCVALNAMAEEICKHLSTS